MSYCPKCGNKVEETMVFCPHCGTSLKGAEHLAKHRLPSTRTPRMKNKRKIKILKKAKSMKKVNMALSAT